MSALRLILCVSAVLHLCTAMKLSEIYTHKSDIQKAIVDKHNALRRSVSPSASNMLEMSWSSAAAVNAKVWAKECAMEHSPPAQRTVNGTICGENLYMSTAVSVWEKGIQDWYNEVQNFTYNVGQRGVVGHYTQVVWYRSNEIGCAAAYCPESPYKYFYVCHYCPAGNYVQSLLTPYKAGPPCGDCPNDCEDGLCTNPCKQFDKAGNCKQLTQLKNACENPLISSWCAASCQCGKKIY